MYLLTVNVDRYVTRIFFVWRERWIASSQTERPAIRYYSLTNLSRKEPHNY